MEGARNECGSCARRKGAFRAGVVRREWRGMKMDDGEIVGDSIISRWRRRCRQRGEASAVAAGDFFEDEIAADCVVVSSAAWVWPTATHTF